MVVTITSADSDAGNIGLPVIIIQNSTGQAISGSYSYLKPSDSADWGSSIFSYTTLSNGQSRAITLPHYLSAYSEYDFKLSTSSSGGYVFTKYNVFITDGMTLDFTDSDLE
jgi:hypothetical protein